MTVERGIEPDVFEIYIEGVPVDLATIAQKQDYFTNELLKIPYEFFKNLISISVNDFKSFIALSSIDKHTIIDKIFNVSCLNDISQFIKQKVKSLSSSISVYENSISHDGDTIKMLNEKI
ncbi:MAG: hypothetical protein EOM74_00835, partial [Methanomicrobia archaeon]|nr:hypothetical protein [Methanomicrobia archaeon]